MATGWTLQPSGTRFDPPIEVHIPNTDGLSPGTVVPVVQWDHDMAFFVPMGLGTISEDGSELVTNTGSGITKAGWGGLAVPLNSDNAQCENGMNKATGQTCGCEIYNGINGNCLAVFGQPEKYKIATNDSTNTEWKGGRGTNPNTATGDEYNVIFQRNSSSPKDSYMSKVEAFCSAKPSSSVLLDVKAAPACSEFEPLILTSKLANTSRPPAGEWGRFTGDMERNLPSLKECINTSTIKLENRVPEIIHEYDLQTYPLSHPNAILSANDPKITNSNCRRVLRDLTPTLSGSHYSWPTAPMSRYWAANIVYAHENFHNTDYISVVAKPLKNALEQEVKQLQSSMCTHNTSYLNQIIHFYEQKNRSLSLQWLGGTPNGVAHEQRAYAIENPQLIALTNAIRVRAQNAGWRSSCR